MIAVDTGSVEYFDAFVSSHPQDMKFVDKLIEELEVRSKLKLCIADRDMVIGVSNSHATAELIERRSAVCSIRLLITCSPLIHNHGPPPSGVRELSSSCLTIIYALRRTICCIGS